MDAMGRRSGFDPLANRKYIEINESYGESSVDSEDPNVEPPEPVMEFMTSRPVDGAYELELYGTKLSPFTLSVTVGRSMGDRGKRFVFSGLIDKGNVVNYKFTYSSALNVPLSASKSVGLSTLRQDLDNCYKLKLFGGKELYRDLNQRVGTFERYLSKKDSLKARHELEKFGETLEREYKRTTKGHDGKPKDKKRFVTEDAYRILNEDVDGLLDLLPKERKKNREDRDEKSKHERD
jgi:hypothetical protein